MKRIHIGTAEIVKNDKAGAYLDPTVLLIEDDGTETLGWGVDILGPSKIIYNLENPLDTGARVWLETDSEVILQEAPPQQESSQ